MSHLRTQKTLGGWGPHWGAYTAPQLQAFPKPHPALSTSGWGEATEGPQVTVEPGPLRALLRHCQHSVFQSGNVSRVLIFQNLHYIGT